jgi:uncharacterized protein YprB with RNaseH-like and TPR domain
MSELVPVAFDLETSGFDEAAVVTVAGFAHQLTNKLILNTGGRRADASHLENDLTDCSKTHLELVVVEDERALLEGIGDFVHERLDGDAHYLTAYNGERWRGGFDLPFLRTACHRNDVRWPFGDIAYADTMDAIERFDTGDSSDLVGVYDRLIGEETCDPFDDSEAAVTAFENGEWLPLLKHNLADIERTRDLANLASRFVPSSDFSMKNLQPPQR